MKKLRSYIKKTYFGKLVNALFAIYLPYHLYGLFPKNKKKWLLSCPFGFFDNGKYFYLNNIKYLKDNFDIELIWLAKKQEEVEKLQALGFEKVYLSRSWAGFSAKVSSKVKISSHFFSIVSYKYCKASIMVNLWHGLPLKNIRFKSEIEPYIQEIKRQKNPEFLYPEVYAPCDVLLATSPLIADYFAQAFLSPLENCFISSYPRCSTFALSEEKLLNNIRKYESQEFLTLTESCKNFSQVFIYMPTWRDSNPNFLSESNFDWEKLNKNLQKKNYLFLFKLHPMSEANFLEDFSNIKVLDSEQDIYPLLPFSSCLITDYSSIYFDYLLLKKNIALFAFDLENYVSKDRDLAFPYEETFFGYQLSTFADLLAFIENYENIDFSIYKEEQEKIKELFWSKPELNDEALINFIREKVEKS